MLGESGAQSRDTACGCLATAGGGGLSTNHPNDASKASTRPKDRGTDPSRSAACQSDLAGDPSARDPTAAWVEDPLAQLVMGSREEVGGDFHTLYTAYSLLTTDY